MKRTRLHGLLWAAAFAVVLGLDRTQAAPGEAPKEHEIKAVFILNFVRFTEWPATAFASTNAPIVIGILGDDPVGATLSQAAADEEAQGRPLVVRRSRRVEDLVGCHLLFVAKSETPRLGQILRAVQDQPVLTVGDTEAFHRAGGMILFVTQGSRVTFDICDKATKRAALVLSAKLLKVARSVRCSPTESP